MSNEFDKIDLIGSCKEKEEEDCTYKFRLGCGHTFLMRGCTCLIKDGWNCPLCETWQYVNKLRPYTNGTEEWKEAQRIINGN
jgi:hypothetical protein